MEREAYAEHLSLSGKHVDDELKAGVRLERLSFWLEQAHFNEFTVHNVA